MRLSDLADESLLDCRARRLSPRTSAWYEANLHYFREWLREQELEDDLHALTLTNARRYSHHLAERPARLATFVSVGARRGVHALTTGPRPISPFFASGFLRTLKVFSRWLADEAQGYTPRDVLAGLRLPKKPKTRKEPLSPAEMSTVLDGHDLRTRIGMRDFAILLTYLSTGLRASELVDLYLGDVHVEAGYLRVRSGKGEKTRVVNLPPETARAILRYRQHHRQPTDDPHLFLTRSDLPMTYDTVKNILAREKRRTGIARLQGALLRDARYLVAIGLHCEGMTIDEATTLIMEATQLARLPAAREAMRGAFDPGYGCYTLGKLLVKQLRRDAEREWGAAFSLRRFHDALLAHGSSPLAILRPRLLKDAGHLL